MMVLGKLKFLLIGNITEGYWLTTGQRVGLWGIQDSTLGNAANGVWTITVIDSKSFRLKW